MSKPCQQTSLATDNTPLICDDFVDSQCVIHPNALVELNIPENTPVSEILNSLLQAVINLNNGGAQGGASVVSGAVSGNNITLVKSDNSTVSIDASSLLDNTNLSRIISIGIDGTSIVLTRDDSTTMSQDISSIIFDTNLPRIVSGEIIGTDLILRRDDDTAVTISAISLLNGLDTRITINENKVSADGSISTHSDVDITGIGDGQVLKWSNSNSRFEPASDNVGAGGSGATQLSELSDVSTSSTADKNVMAANGTSYNGVQLDASYISDFDTEVSNNPSVIANTSKVSYPGDQSADEVSVTPTGDITSTNVQDALEELQNDINVVSGTNGTVTNVEVNNDNLDFTGSNGAFNGSVDLSTIESIVQNTAKVGYTDAAVDARLITKGIQDNASPDQDASEVPFSSSGNLASSNVQAALQELDSEKLSKSEVKTIGGQSIEGFGNIEVGTTQNASQVSFTPFGNVTSTEVQAAIQEIDSKKLSNSNIKTIGGQSIEGTGDIPLGTDNLGNHTATQDLNLDGNNVLGVQSLVAVSADFEEGFIQRLANIRFTPTDTPPSGTRGIVYTDSSESRLKFHDGISYKTLLLEGDVAGSGDNLSDSDQVLPTGITRNVRLGDAGTLAVQDNVANSIFEVSQGLVRMDNIQSITSGGLVTVGDGIGLQVGNKGAGSALGANVPGGIVFDLADDEFKFNRGSAWETLNITGGTGSLTASQLRQLDNARKFLIRNIVNEEITDSQHIIASTSPDEGKKVVNVFDSTLPQYVTVGNSGDIGDPILYRNMGTGEARIVPESGQTFIGNDTVDSFGGTLTEFTIPQYAQVSLMRTSATELFVDGNFTIVEETPSDVYLTLSPDAYWNADTQTVGTLNSWIDEVNNYEFIPINNAPIVESRTGGKQEVSFANDTQADLVMSTQPALLDIDTSADDFTILAYLGDNVTSPLGRSIFSKYNFDASNTDIRLSTNSTGGNMTFTTGGTVQNLSGWRNTLEDDFIMIRSNGSGGVELWRNNVLEQTLTPVNSGFQSSQPWTMANRPVAPQSDTSDHSIRKFLIIKRAITNTEKDFIFNNKDN